MSKIISMTWILVMYKKQARKSIFGKICSAWEKN